MTSCPRLVVPDPLLFGGVGQETQLLGVEGEMFRGVGVEVGHGHHRPKKWIPPGGKRHLQPQGGVGLGFQVGGQRGRDPTQLPGHPVTIVHARCRPRPPVIDPIKGLGPGIEQPSKGIPHGRWQPTETLDDGQQASGHHVTEHHVKQQFFVGPARTGASATQLGVTSQREEGFQIATGVQISNGDLSTVYHGDLLRSGAGSCSPCPFIMDCISTCLGSIVAHTYAASNRAYLVRRFHVWRLVLASAIRSCSFEYPSMSLTGIPIG